MACYRCSMAFTGVLLADLLWLVVEITFTKNSRKARTWLFGASLWKIIKALWLVEYSSKFAFIDRRSWNSECPGLWYALVIEYLSWLAKYIDTKPGAISNPFESLQKFQGRSAFWFIYIAELKIKYFLKIYFFQTLIFANFFDFIH